MEFQKINGVTPNGSSFNLEALYRLLPACFTEKDVKGPDGVHHTERVIDFDKLKSFLNNCGLMCWRALDTACLETEGKLSGDKSSLIAARFWYIEALVV